jgi:hypothetical protein
MLGVDLAFLRARHHNRSPIELVQPARTASQDFLASSLRGPVQVMGPAHLCGRHGRWLMKSADEAQSGSRSVGLVPR